VLRRVTEADWPAWVERLAPPDELGRVAFAAGHPDWVARALLDALDGDVGELRTALAEDRPVTHLVARPGLVTRDALLAEAGDAAAPGPWSPYAVHLRSGDPAALPSVRAGRAGVQDEGSQLAAETLATAQVDGPDRWWLDMCAGPGGKAALLTAIAGARGADTRVLAAELQPHRARLVAAASAAAPAVAVADGRRPAWRDQAFDRVLVDVPCTGLGALRRRPEVRWRRDATDAARLQPLQQALLESAVAACRPGGLVGYVTCSPHLAETRDVVRRVVAASAGRVEYIDARPMMPQLPGLGPGPDVQLWPHRHGTDAMYIALLRTAAEQPSPL
jgi:16S rRNA (cytosine967-C5)-methyltransferase